MKHLRDRFLWLVGTCFGLGMLPVAPGTWGTLPGVAVFVAIILLAPAWLHTWLILAALVVACAITVAMGRWAERCWQRKDPNVFVTDEVAGFLGTVLLFRAPSVLLTSIWAFCVTRIFDIAKIPPARQLERLPGGWGVLLDDLSASLYAAMFLHLIRLAFPAWFG